MLKSPIIKRCILPEVKKPNISLHNNSSHYTKQLIECAVLTLKAAAMLLKQNSIIIMETDTIVGLSCLKSSADKLRKLKKKPVNAPLTALVDSPTRILVPEQAQLLMMEKQGSATIITSYTYGIRFTSSATIRELIREVNEPIISTSCNIHNQPYATTAEEAQKIFNLPIFTIPEEKSGKPSTIIDTRHNPPKIIRP